MNSYLSSINRSFMVTTFLSIYSQSSRSRRGGYLKYGKIPVQLCGFLAIGILRGRTEAEYVLVQEATE
jgi:hypothetical protein